MTRCLQGKSMSRWSVENVVWMLITENHAWVETSSVIIDLWTKLRYDRIGLEILMGMVYTNESWCRRMIMLKMDYEMRRNKNLIFTLKTIYLHLYVFTTTKTSIYRSRHGGSKITIFAYISGGTNSLIGWGFEGRSLFCDWATASLWTWGDGVNFNVFGNKSKPPASH